MTSSTAGERVRSLRRLLGISQVELASAVHVDQSLISRVERGLAVPTGELLDTIAAVTATPRSFFDKVPAEVPASTLRFRKLAGARQSDTTRATVLFQEAFRVVADLLAEARYTLPNLPLIAEDIGDDDIEDIADETREALGLSLDGPVSHLTRVLERAGVAIAPLSIPGDDGQEDEAVGHFGASHWWGPGDIAMIGYFAGGPGDRQRFTLAHEAGHLVLHTRRRNVRDPEREANRFAGALLLPRARAKDVLSDHITLRELFNAKARWGISAQALIMRGSHLGVIDEQRKTSLFKQLSARGWRKVEPVTVYPEQPELLWRLLIRKYGQPLPYSKLVADLGLSAVVLRSLAPTPGRRPSGANATVRHL